DAIGVVNFPDPFFGESVPLQTHRVYAIGVGSALGGRFGKWEHIAGDGGAAADKGMRSNAYEVMHRTQRPYRRPVSHGYVPAQRGCVGHDDVAANLTIMCDVGIGHDQVVAADPGASPALYGAAIDGDKFTNGVMVADLQPRRFAGIADVLRRHANRGKREENVARADFRGTFDGDVREQTAAFGEFHPRPDYAVRPNFARRMYFAFWIDDRCGMNGH